MKITNVLSINEHELARREWKKLFDRIAYQDAEGNVIHPWRYHRDTGNFLIPRGAWDLVPDHVEERDLRAFPQAPQLDFKLELDAELPDGQTFVRQEEAVRQMLKYEQGQVIRPPGSGKTQIVLAFCARVGTRCLVLVNTEDLLQQWLEYAAKAIPDADIGVIRGQQLEVGDITVATVQTFHKRLHGDLREWRRKFGAVILDEGHHGPAITFETTINMMAAKYRIAVTASATRADGRHPYLRTLFGPVIHHMPFKSNVKVEVKPVKTNFKYRYRGSWEWSRLVTALCQDDDRNRLIAKKVDEQVKAGYSTLILSRRIEQLQRIQVEMEEDSVIVAAALMSKKDRKRVLADFKAGRVRCVLATQLADEGLDVPILSRVVLVHPGKAEGRLVQQVGRALREHPGKDDALVLDVVDHRVGVLNHQWRKRRMAFRKMKIPVKGGRLWR